MKYSGYSGSPLVKKIGVKPGHTVCVLNAPEDYEESMSPLPENATIIRDLKECEIVHAFFHEMDQLIEHYQNLVSAISKNGMIWISWPKKSSGVSSDLDENKIRRFILDQGLVDVKVASYDQVYSCLKFVYRKKDRN